MPEADGNLTCKERSRGATAFDPAGEVPPLLLEEKRSRDKIKRRECGEKPTPVTGSSPPARAEAAGGFLQALCPRDHPTSRCAFTSGAEKTAPAFPALTSPLLSHLTVHPLTTVPSRHYPYTPTRMQTRFSLPTSLPHIPSFQSFPLCHGVAGLGIPWDAAGRDVTCRYPRRAFHPLYSSLTPASEQQRGRSGSLGKLGRATDAFPPPSPLPAPLGCMGASYGESTFHYNAPTLPLWSTNPESPEPETRLAWPEKRLFLFFFFIPPPRPCFLGLELIQPWAGSPRSIPSIGAMDPSAGGGF